jgi:hypothetical protein
MLIAASKFVKGQIGLALERKRLINPEKYRLHNWVVNLREKGLS